MSAAEPQTCNCFAIRSAARQVSQFYDQHLSASGLRTSQFSVLAKLKRSGALSIGEMAALMQMDRTTMGRAVRPLEREGLVEIGAGRDGRTRALRLTPAGEARYATARPLWAAAQAAFESAYGAEKARSLRALLAEATDFAAEAAPAATES